jgi:DNA-directed RNA polymerase specialized sigma24 family protein
VNNWATILCRHHKEWVSIVKNFGEYNYAEDIVQEMYVRVHNSNAGEKVVINGEPNRAYIWSILKNTFITYQKEKAKVHKVDIDSLVHLRYEHTDITYHKALNTIQENIEAEMYRWHTYDRKLFEVHVQGERSMRNIAAGTDISLKSIFNTIKNCKQRLRNEIGEDFEDLINEDYERI